jgi:hypothetical protein
MARLVTDWSKTSIERRRKRSICGSEPPFNEELEELRNKLECLAGSTARKKTQWLNGLSGMRNIRGKSRPIPEYSIYPGC